jgi:type II secretory pathway pseudopilin PulG
MTRAEIAVARSARLSGRARSGFTLLEMVVLLVFVGILAAMAGSKITTIKYQQQVVRAASTVQTAMEQAYAVASRNRAPIRISWSSTSGKLTVTKRDGSITYTTLDFTTMGLKASEITVNNNTVDVFPNGWASDTLSVTINASRAGATFKRRIRMSKAGMVKVL